MMRGRVERRVAGKFKAVGRRAEAARQPALMAFALDEHRDAHPDSRDYSLTRVADCVTLSGWNLCAMRRARNSIRSPAFL